MPKFEKDQTIECEECGIQYSIRHNTKEPILYCPFCGTEILGASEESEDFGEYEEDEEDEEDEDWS